MRFKKIVRPVLYVTGFLIISFVVFTMMNKYRISSAEQNFHIFLSSSREGEARNLLELLVDGDKYYYACVLGPYQKSVRRTNNLGDVSEQIYEKINSKLGEMNYREGFWGLLSSEAHWALIASNEKVDLLRIYEISSNKIPLVSPSGGRECFIASDVFVVKKRNNQYPYGFGLSTISNIK